MTARAGILDPSVFSNRSAIERATIDHRPSTVGPGVPDRDQPYCDYFQKTSKRSDCSQQLGGSSGSNLTLGTGCSCRELATRLLASMPLG